MNGARRRPQGEGCTTSAAARMGAGPEGTGLRPRRAAKGTRNQEDWAVGPHQGRVGTRRPRARSPRPRASWLRMSRDPRPHPPQPGPAPRRPASAKIAGQRGLAATARAAHVAAGSGLGPSAPAHHRPPTTQAQPYLGGRHGGAAAVAAARLARSLLVPGPLGGDSELSHSASGAGASRPPALSSAQRPEP